MQTLYLKVENKRAFLPVPAVIVCGNSDYKINFSFDEEWENRNVKTARFFYNGTYEEVVFTGNICEVPVLSNATGVYIGVFSGDVYTTTPAYIPCEKSILCLGGTHAEPPEDVYNQIIQLISELQIEKGKPTDELPLMDGEASAGSNMEYARADHVHPTDTTRASAKDLAETAEKLAEVESIAKGAHRAYHYGDLATMITALNDLPNTTYKSNDNINIIDVDVPDFWVVAVAENSIPYTYTDDTALVNDIMANGTIRVGYYVLARLETGKVILTDYVKNTDYATANEAGLMYPVSKCLIVAADGGLHLVGADKKIIDAKASTYHPLTPSMLDYIVKLGLTTNTETWTDDTTDENGEVVKGDKTKARELIGAVGFNDYATADGTKAGIVQLYGYGGGGLNIDANGKLYVQSPSISLLKMRGAGRPITPGEMDSAFWMCMTGYRDIWNGQTHVGSYGNYYKHLTDEEKGYARRWLGLYHDIVSEEYQGGEYDIGGGSTGIGFGGYYLATTNIPSTDELDKYVAYFDAYNHAISYYEYFSFTLDRFNVTEMQGAKKLSFSIPNIPQTIVLIVTDYDACNSEYGTSFVSNGVYLGNNWNDFQGANSQMYSYGSCVLSLCKIDSSRKIPDRFLDLENSPVIKALLARIEALEAK